MFIVLVVLLGHHWLAHGANQCFADAIPALERRELVNDGQVYPVGLYLIDYAAQHAAAELVNILLQEKLGYVVQKMVNGSASFHSFFALAGCTRPTNYTHRGCSQDSTTRAHISVEVWTAGYPDEWQFLQQEYPSVVPRNLGSMGYVGTTSLFIPSHVQELAYNVEGLSLDFYRDYNTSWERPSQYFTTIDQINRSKLMLCEETLLMSVKMMSTYLEITGDHEGVSQGTGGITGRCFDQYFWYAPACRRNSSSCIPCFTGGTGWGSLEMLQKATFLGIPLAWITAKDWNAYSALPKDYDSIFYWWTPDPTFLSLNAEQIMFPAHNGVEWAKGDHRSAAFAIQIDKYISQDLNKLAPDIEEFMRNYNVDIKHVEMIMADQLQSGESYFDAACRWLHANGDWWQQWIPDKTKCFARYGLYNAKEERFVDNRANRNNLKCEVCPPGSFSDEMQDDNGTTFICRTCHAGSYQVFGASTMCDACPTGEYQNETGQNFCKRCGLGAYQDLTGQSFCQPCPNGTTTTGLGSVFVTDCGCVEGTVNVKDSIGLFHCVPCPEGLICPFASTIQSLQQGEAPLGPQYVPQVSEGYLSDPDDPLVIYKCEPKASCPGGKPGECAAGLLGTPCATCSDGKTWTGEECADCRDETFVLWAILLLLSSMLLLKSYDLVEARAAGQMSPLQVSEWKFFKTMNCMGTFIQVGFATLSALSLQPLMCYQHPNGLYSVLKYPSTFCGHSEQVIMIAIGMVLMTIFVLGFFAACSLAAWKMPTWSLEKNHRWVQSFTFLTGKFRLDAWYFGTPLLLRGLGLGVTVALGTDRPEVQISLASVVILLYLCTLVRVWPWKARVLNVADTALSAGMLLLVRQNSHAASSDESFREVFSALIIVLLFGSTAFMLMLCVWALARSRCGGDAGTSLLNLGFRSSAEMVSRALKDCAEGLLEMEAEQLKEKLGKMNTYDLAALQATITLTSIELLSSSDWHFNARVSLQAISHGGFVRSRSFEPQAPAPPTPSDHANDAPGDVSEEDSEDMANRKIGLVDDQPTQSEMM